MNSQRFDQHQGAPGGRWHVGAANWAMATTGVVAAAK